MHVPLLCAIVHCSYETWIVHHVSREQPLLMNTTVGVLINVYIFNTKDISNLYFMHGKHISYKTQKPIYRLMRVEVENQQFSFVI